MAETSIPSTSTSTSNSTSLDSVPLEILYKIYKELETKDILILGTLSYELFIKTIGYRNFNENEIRFMVNTPKKLNFLIDREYPLKTDSYFYLANRSFDLYLSILNMNPSNFMCIICCCSNTPKKFEYAKNTLKIQFYIVPILIVLDNDDYINYDKILLDFKSNCEYSNATTKSKIQPISAQFGKYQENSAFEFKNCIILKFIVPYKTGKEFINCLNSCDLYPLNLTKIDGLIIKTVCSDLYLVKKYKS